MIEIRDVHFKYEDTQVLKGINLDICEGKFIALLGHNGSGKSTLAKLINGLILPTEGEIIVDGMKTSDEENIWNIRSRAGMVFQNPDNQLVATIVEDDVAFGPENLGIEPSEIRQRVYECLKTVDMYEHREEAPHMLSGGQKQRVAIAGILAMSPNYIILDEPTAMLDPIGRKEVMDTIIKLNKEQNKTIILITHYMEEAALSDEIVVLEDGQIVLSGSPREVFSHVERIKELGLDVPQVTEMADFLNKNGFDVNSKILEIDELIEELEQICRL